MTYWRVIHVRQLYKRILKDGWCVDRCVKREEAVHITLRHPDKNDRYHWISFVLKPM